MYKEVLSQRDYFPIHLPWQIYAAPFTNFFWSLIDFLYLPSSNLLLFNCWHLIRVAVHYDM